MTEINYITVEQALDLIEDKMHLVTGLGCSEAQSILSNIHKIGDRINKIRVSNCLSMKVYEFMKPEYTEKFLLASWFYSAPVKKMHKNF